MRICVDAGHVPNWRNGVDPKYDEGKMSWTLAGFLKKELEFHGFEVVCTRSDANISKDTEVFTRGTVAHTWQCDLLLSLHSDGITDAAGRPITTAKGVSVFMSNLRPDSKALAIELGTAVARAMGTVFRGAQTRLYGGTATPNADYYGVIRGAIGFKGERYPQAAFLIEHGFHTNPAECAWLMNEDNLRVLAKIEAAILAKHYDPTPPPPPAKEDWEQRHRKLYTALEECLRLNK